MAHRIRHHVNPLKLEYVTTGAGRLALPAGAVIEVELGSADGQWLFERAVVDPNLLLIGIEIRRPLVEAVNRRTRASGLEGRVRAVYANLSAELDTLFADGSIARFVLNFPDPWFKRRHHKRRVVSGELVADLIRKLSAGGELFFQSDVWDVALDALAALEAAAPQLENVYGSWSFCPDNPLGVRSRREERSLAASRRVWRLLYRKPDSKAK